jgi:hypothetical protein
VLCGCGTQRGRQGLGRQIERNLVVGVGENAIVGKECIYTDLPSWSSRRKVFKLKKSVRPDLNASLLVVTDDVHGRLAKLDDTFLLQFLNGLD